MELRNANNATQFPIRVPYGSDDTATNPDVQAAYSDYEPVWWARGTW